MNDSTIEDAFSGKLPFKRTRRWIDAAENRYRYFVLRVDSAHGVLIHGPEDLGGNPCVVRRWGRSGLEHLWERYVWPASEAALERWVRGTSAGRARITATSSSSLAPTLLEGWRSPPMAKPPTGR